MEKLDLTKRYKTYYTAATKPEIVEFEPAQYLSILGKGDPSGADFAERIQALFATAYAIKFHYKGEGKDFVVAKLEGLWWFDEARFGSPSMSEAPKQVPRSEWEYRLLIRLPDFVEEAVTIGCAKSVVSKKKIALAAAIEFYRMTEGKCVQMMHVGPFSTEPQTLAQLLDFCQANGFSKNGLHHEIYLSDFRNTEPERLKTILREPVVG
ncbi:MAG: GyrI-like domain-containing protein [Saprospiraceae bacterium]|nr:GyrI-like domain-containing protein [Saprospiraceae bacterium]